MPSTRPALNEDDQVGAGRRKTPTSAKSTVVTEEGRVAATFDVDALTGEELLTALDPTAARPVPRPDGSPDPRPGQSSATQIALAAVGCGPTCRNSHRPMSGGRCSPHVTLIRPPGLADAYAAHGTSDGARPVTARRHWARPRPRSSSTNSPCAPRADLFDVGGGTAARRSSHPGPALAQHPHVGRTQPEDLQGPRHEARYELTGAPLPNGAFFWSTRELHLGLNAPGLGTYKSAWRRTWASTQVDRDRRVLHPPGAHWPGKGCSSASFRPAQWPAHLKHGSPLQRSMVSTLMFDVIEESLPLFVDEVVPATAGSRTVPAQVHGHHAARPPGPAPAPVVKHRNPTTQGEWTWICN